MRRLARIAAAVGLGTVMACASVSPASAAEATMRNELNGYLGGYCGGTVKLTYFLTDRTDIVWASYYDEYWSSSRGDWIAAGPGQRLHDSWAAGQTMITGLINNTMVGVRADHYVTTRQSGCTQRYPT